MDEPLSNLDKNLRIQMRSTIREIQRDVGITTIFVTHDQEEAMGMADRIALMRDGRLEQVDTPTDLYARPNSAWAARFVGSSNILDATVERSDNTRTEVVLGGRSVRAPASEAAVGEHVRLLMRPEALSVQATAGADLDAANVFHGTVAELTFLGPNVVYSVDIGLADSAPTPVTPASDEPAPETEGSGTEAAEAGDVLVDDRQLIEVTDTFRGADALLEVGTPVQLAIDQDRIVVAERGSS